VTAYEAAIFDLDGLLVDSEILWHRAELELLVPLGAAIDASSTRSTKGMFVGEVVDHYHGLVGWESPPRDELIELLLDRVGSLVEQEGRLMPGATRALDLCARLARCGLASSTPRSLIDRVLAHFGIGGAFEVVHSAEDELFGKPDPAVYLTTARLLDVAPSNCLAFEDSPAGVLAATSATMGCVAVPAAEERDHPAFDRATVVLDSLDELNEAWLTSQFAGVADRDRTEPKG
jgi:mannitol-1-/sugar-/sorbitol-6-/2-deoxyglucose-6-phosphatase